MFIDNHVLFGYYIFLWNEDIVNRLLFHDGNIQNNAHHHNVEQRQINFLITVSGSFVLYWM